MNMDLQRSFLHNLVNFHQDKSINMDEVGQSLFLTMELEHTKLQAQEQLKAKDQEISQLKDLLSRAIRERDEAQDKCQKLMFEKVLLLQSTPHSGISSLEEDHRNNNGFSSSDCDESIVSSPSAEAEPDLPLLIDRPLPEKGKFLQAVIKAGPLLQTLLLAGPLPQWRHPPPPLDTYQIPPPPVVIPSTPALPTPLSAHHPFSQETFDGINCGATNRKRGLSEISHSAINELKYQRMVLQ
ncbi:hypothetical protein C2S52_002300 [Perilla frutescens var. hirtella]|nr:hypothetical protein C2S51_013112 [Perilla frutescens var. frutescens]KAH6791823.1 hypothetical protein C2S52_002300 [Perilla frutescens var. hirtella]